MFLKFDMFVGDSTRSWNKPDIKLCWVNAADIIQIEQLQEGFMLTLRNGNKFTVSSTVEGIQEKLDSIVPKAPQAPVKSPEVKLSDFPTIF